MGSLDAWHTQRKQKDCIHIVVDNVDDRAPELREADGKGIESIGIEDAGEVRVGDRGLPTIPHQPHERDGMRRLYHAARKIATLTEKRESDVLRLAVIAPCPQAPARSRR